MSHNMVLVLAVLVQVSECPRIQNMGGERGGTTVNIEFIVSVESVSLCNFKPLILLSVLLWIVGDPRGPMNGK